MSNNAFNPVPSYADAISNLFEPDFLLPTQFLVPDEQGLLGGERKLMAAVLSDGVEAYITQVTSKTKGKTRTDAQEWVETIDDGYVFSFDNVCESLGINPNYLRLGLFRYVDTVNSQNASTDENEIKVWKKIRRPRKQ